MSKKFKLPDTGQNKSYDVNGNEINISNDNRLFGQDGAFEINPIQYTKLDARGKVLNDDITWDEGLRLIQDENTGLIWEVKSPVKEDINYYKNKYNFEEINEKYIAKLNKNKYCGRSDWRVPNKDELRSILNYSKVNPAIDLEYFPNTLSGFYWTDAEYKMQDYFGWVISFGLGGATANSKKSRRAVRAVAGGNDRKFGVADKSRFVDNGDGTISDNVTNLMWQKGENERMSWYKALEKAKSMTLGAYKDWRLPTIKELNTILNINYDDNWWYFKEYFPAEGLKPPLLHYFSSSSYSGTYAWVTNFCFGYDGYYANKNTPLLCRMVRNIYTNQSNENVFKVPNDGQKILYDDMGNIFEKIKNGDRFYGQAGNYNINPQKYIKLGNEGIEISNPTKEFYMVKDENTGLVWEIKSKNKMDINYNERKYNYNEAKRFIDQLNQENYGGFSDWRMPNKEELRSIVKYGDEDLAIDQEYFVNSKSEFYWSKDIYGADTKLMWGIYFGYGCGIAYSQEQRFCIRAVRDGYNRSFGDTEKVNFADNKDGTISDLNTGLMWKKEESPNLTWEEALKYCEELNIAGYGDWRMPSMKELGTILDLSYSNERWYFEKYFPDTQINPLGFYWSSNTFADTFAWGINFKFGYDGYYGGKKEGKYPFRPVRNISK